MYAIDVGFQDVYSTKDWLKPSGNEAKNWKSKVDFEIITRINHRAGNPRQELIKAAEAEIRVELQHDALISQLKSSRGLGEDLINRR